MPDDLYTADILRWSGQQADFLRHLARGERVNDAIDWVNVIEEVESVGRSELSAVRSLLTRAIERLMKIHLWPDGPLEHWRQEVLVFLQDAQDRAAPSMRQAIDPQQLWRKARTRVDEGFGQPPPKLPDACPFGVDDLLPPADHDRASVAALLAALDQI